MGYTINADSSPDYDDWGWDDYWSVEDWKNWHGEMEKKYGEAEASRRWLEAWAKNGFQSNAFVDEGKILGWAKAKGLAYDSRPAFQSQMKKVGDYVPPATQNQGQVQLNPQTGEQTQVGIQPDIEKLKEEREEQKGKFTWLYVSFGILLVGLGVTYFIIKKRAKQ